MVIEFLAGYVVGTLLCEIAAPKFNSYNYDGWHPESTDEYMARRKAADDAKFKEFLEKQSQG